MPFVWRVFLFDSVIFFCAEFFKRRYKVRSE